MIFTVDGFHLKSGFKKIVLSQKKCLNLKSVFAKNLLSPEKPLPYRDKGKLFIETR